ncbi:MDIS1-interacting receptor like kinase 2-like [Ziziphus jujuba]|uniref:MDIS1-interacting receptor like kinase 2-like n=1 Tax=Ziziphus jujuba TaxID=326968 RepID=A0ABM4A7V4_ZIZJJ|nr:MDIS1-interacting receptor like kinase 2-like [Ziziphus jujuba]
MASSISIVSAVAVVAWATTYFSCGVNMENSSLALAASIPISETPRDPAALEREAKARQRTGWWSNYVNTSTSPCNLTVYLDVSGAGLVGSIPAEIGKSSKLIYVDLFSNCLTGQLPLSLGNLSQLQMLNIYDNQINGSIPPELDNLKNLFVLNLGINNFCGPIPSELGLLINLTRLFIDGNKIKVTLDLSHNSIGGNIPPQLGKLSQAQTLNFAYNNLTGHIPSFITSVCYAINLSYNCLEGPIPQEVAENSLVGAYMGNKELCGQVTSFPTCLTKHHGVFYNIKIRIIVSISLILALTFIVLLAFYFYRRSPKNNEGKPTDIATKNGDIFCIWNFYGKIAFQDIIQVTGDFDIRYCIGTSGYGSVYKAQLSNGKVVALKKLHSLEAEEPVFRKSFMNEVKR